MERFSNAVANILIVVMVTMIMGIATGLLGFILLGLQTVWRLLLGGV